MSEDHLHIGDNFETPDSTAKVTGRAKYADDVMLDNMLHAKTVKSPYAHAYVESIDTSEAEAMSGVEAVITWKDLPGGGQTGYASMQPPLDREPRCYGTPVAAVAAVDEYTAASAVEAIDVNYRVLDHVIDPVETLKPDGPNPRMDGNAVGEDDVTTIKWDDADFDAEFPQNPGDMNYGWSYGDPDAGFAESDIVLEDVQVAHSVPQNPLEPRSNVAHYRSDGKLMYWASSQSVGMPAATLANYVGLDIDDVVWISNYCGGGFGSKAGLYPQQVIPALLSMKSNRPVKIRGTRKEEFFWGNGRTALHFDFRIGLKSDGEINALEMTMIGDAGAYTSDVLRGLSSASKSVSAMFNPEHMRVQGVGVYTNTPKRWANRGPGQNQLAMAIAPVLDKAAEAVGMDRLEFRIRNSADHGDPVGPDRTPNTSSYLSEAFEKVGDQFGYEDRVESASESDGSMIRGIGIGCAEHGAGAVGFDGLITIRTDGTVEMRTGVGNLGTYSYAGTARAGAETLKVPWDQVEVKWGRSDENAFTMLQAGSNTSFTTSLTQSKAAETAIEYMKELASMELGGDPEEYVVEGGEVYHETTESQSLSFAEAAQLAVEYGGKYSGEEIPLADKLHPMTVSAAEDSVGNALVAFGKTGPEDAEGAPHTFCTSMAEVSIDTETGELNVEELRGVTDCGTVIHPQSLEAQVQGGMLMGLGYTTSEHYSFDEDTGIPYNTDLYTNKPPSILDFGEVHGDAVNKPDFSGAHGTKGMGEPPLGAGASAVRSAVSDALGVDIQPPMTPDKILEALESEEVDL